MDFASHIRGEVHAMRLIPVPRIPWASVLVAAGMVSLIVGSAALLRPADSNLSGKAQTAGVTDQRKGTPIAALGQPSAGPATIAPIWTATATGPVTVQPTVADGVVYWGSWDGFEHATSTAGGVELWKTYLGRTTAPQCDPQQAGVASAAALGTVSVGGTRTTLVFVGGGDAVLYALDARSGAVVWKQPMGVHNEDFLWSTPLFYNGSVYMGDASFGDCPLTQGKVVKVDAATGRVQATFKSVPDGCIGGGVWTALTLDPSDASLYFATGTLSPCEPTIRTQSESLVKIRASDMTLVGSWQIPPAERVLDGDFGAAPTLFAATINGRTHDLVGVVNKNGLFYAFDRDYVGAGPVWTRRVARGGVRPQSGDGSISGAAWDGKRLYVAGGKTTIDGQACKGSLRALDTRVGEIVWERCLTEGAVLGTVGYHNGMVAVAEGNRVVVVDAATGALRYITAPALKAAFWSPPLFVEDWIYQGSVTGALLAIRYES
jgi:polyvinyl alcohol dehydrogenase (cytochrome)